MFRLLGFTTGAALAVGAIVMVMGTPELSEKASVADAVVQPNEPAALPPSVEAPPETVVVPADTLDVLPVPRAGSEAAEAIDSAGEPLWHSFWNPFRSEIAANGFAARLTALTGIDYRVVRLEPGAYQVAFAYADDTERAAKIARIEAATGLHLPEETP